MGGDTVGRSGACQPVDCCPRHAHPHHQPHNTADAANDVDDVTWHHDTDDTDRADNDEPRHDDHTTDDRDHPHHHADDNPDHTGDDDERGGEDYGDVVVT